MIYVLYYLLLSAVVGALEVWVTWDRSFTSTRDQAGKSSGNPEAIDHIFRDWVILVGLFMWAAACVFWPYTYLWSPLRWLARRLRGDG